MYLSLFAMLVMKPSLCVGLCLASEAMRGSTPLDVAASSVMDNNGLALALEEPDLEKVCFFCIKITHGQKKEKKKKEKRPDCAAKNNAALCG